MTEVDTVMHEGGGAAPIPATTRQITAVAESSDDNEVVTAVTVTAVAAASSDSGDAEKESKLSTTENIPNAMMKSTESIVPTSTTNTTTSSTTSSSTSPSNDSSKKKIHETVNVSPKSENTPMEIDDDDDDDDEDDNDNDNDENDNENDNENGIAAVTTTTEQECEEDSQVTSSSTDIDATTNLKQQKSLAVPVTSQQQSDANRIPPAKEKAESESESKAPAPAETTATENSNSEIVDGNDLSEDEDDDDEAEAEAEAKVETKTEKKSTKEEEHSSAKTNNFNDKSQSCDSVNEIRRETTSTSHQDHDIKERKELNSDIAVDAQEKVNENEDEDEDENENQNEDEKENEKETEKEEEEDCVLSSEKNPSQSNKETDVLSESHIPALPSSIPAINAKNCIKETINATHIDLVEKMDDNTADETDPLGMDNELSIVNSSTYEVKNGLNESSIATKDLTNNNNNSNNNNNGIVDLDDDSDDDDDMNSNHNDDDDDDDDDDDEEGGGDSKKQSEKSNGGGKSREKNASSNKGKSICSDSDGAVVIGSDSENEIENPSPKVLSRPIVRSQNLAISKPPQPQPPPPSSLLQPESDDDDDDCVVIEDDSPSEMTPKPNNDQGRRKSAALDSENNSDDSQPPSKRQRRIGIGTTTGQLTIKDARSLLPTETTLPPAGGNGKKSLSLNDGGVVGVAGGVGVGVAGGVGVATGVIGGGVYPINITPAGSNITLATSGGGGGGPPKLAPIGGGIGITLPTVPSANSNANTNPNLLPGLTDDMFVLEAPSFIVPYIYEKPPGDCLKDIVKEIEAKYELSRDDLIEADKLDEFDMMTEQNKEDRDPNNQTAAAAANKKKKRRRFAADVDDSWSEESDDDDDDDDDDDSEAGVRTKVLIKEATDDLTALKGAIKPAAAVAQSITAAANTTNTPVKPGQENYFESPLGKFFMDIGVGLVQEFVQTDLIRLQKRKMRKSDGKSMMDFGRAIAALSGNLEASKKKNSAFKFTVKRCEFCNFKSESALAMAHHYETPHMNGPLYKCNFCIFEIRNATEIVYHMEAMHNIKARLIKPLPYHQCPNCGFEDNGKAKLARHQPVCAKKFRPELNLAPPNDWEAPAKIPRIKPRHGLVGTATAYQAMAAQAAAQKAALATIQQQQQQQQARNIQAAAIAAQNAVNKIRGRPPVLAKVGGNVGPNGTAAIIRGATSQTGPRAMATNVVLPNNYQLPGNQIIPASSAMHTGKKAPSLPGQPSISITPIPRQSTTTAAQAAATAAASSSSTPSTSKTTLTGMKPGRNPTRGKAQCVICEICDIYIKDLEQLRNHMQWVHEVKIHPKMIYNRPPLNCQKCQFRFFTDQGLERHLLGSHGLVTSSMQEAANKGKDAGRCPVCGRMYQWNLLNHVARDHHMTLKPAHLSYKCTVCTATFGMYKQFETHVYTAHSTVAKKAMDSKKNNSASATAVNASGNAGASGSAASSSSSVTSQRSGLSTAASNDALLKPLKINDEITIIPQPASKPRITNMESHVID